MAAKQGKNDQQVKAATNTSSKSLLIVLLVVLTLLLLVAAFFIGRATANKSPNEVAAPQQQTQQQTQQQAQTQQAQQGKGQVAALATDPKLVEAIHKQRRNQQNDPRSIGSANAPVVMLEYGDFSCPMCARYDLMTSPQLQKYIDSGVLRIEWHDLSFFRDYHSELAAAGGIAAAQQGKFWQYKHAAYELSANGDHPVWTDALVKQVAEKAGVPNIAEFMKVVKNPATLQEVNAETQAGQQIGIQGTPFFFINDYYISGAQPTETFIATIEAAQKAAQQK